MNTIKAIFVALNVAILMILIAIMPYLLIIVGAYLLTKSYLEKDM